MLSVSNVLAFLVFPGGLFAVFFGLLLLGLERIAVARFQGRVGPPVYQNLLDIIKLQTKEVLVPADATNKIFFGIAPVFGFAGMLAAIFILPISGVHDGAGVNSDLIVLLYLMALPAVSHVMGGSSSGSTYAAISVSREVVLMFAYEITFILVLFTVALQAGAGEGALFSLKGIVDYQVLHGSFVTDFKMIPAFIAFGIFMLATLEVPPFHIAENDADVMKGYLMEYSGMALALFEITHALKLLVLITVLQVLFMPAMAGESIVVNLLWYMGKSAGIVAVIALIHASLPSFRVDQAFKFLLIVPTALSLLSLGLVLFS
ncbi:hydrogenase [Desulfolithobacter dissulfuricans]|uniref:Hydrogenase n=1 Tax=Desulfolithobacter dissulfuricans TaxID=2795293 RepID=A0A915XK22_9BACT|nr:complex I subunit 1 family protein [Desulfolithobacter dissulfuricans]BCO09417.1 hydrogenase [Desulfolithobacter dissulfuricans]